LYAYYRLSDHELTNITLKGKVHQRVPVWFEGHMNWTFRKCTFKESFYFGVEGDKLTEDTRGTEINPEPFPEYGHNGVNFEQCSFGKSFEIQNNCNVVFYNCSFDPIEGELIVTIKDSCRVEFINCSFNCALTFDEYCDVNFRNCTFESSQSHFIRATNHCKIIVDKCDLSTPPEGVFFDIATDCFMSVYACEDISSNNDVFVVKDQSHLKIIDVDSVSSSQSCFILEDSKLEIMNAASLSSENTLITSLRSEILIRAVSAMQAMQDVISADNSVLRLSGISNILSSQSNCFALTESRLYGKDISQAAAYRVCFLGEDSSLELTNISTLTGRDGVFHFSGAGEIHTREIGTISAELGDAISLAEGCKLFIHTLTSLSASQGQAVVAQDSEVHIRNAATMEGRLGAVNVTSCFLSLYEIGNLTSAEGGACIQITEGSYSLRDITAITGEMGGILVNTSRGVVETVAEISSASGPAVEIDTCSGPTEWENISTIRSDTAEALVVNGDVNKLQFHTVSQILGSISSGIVWVQTGGVASLFDIDYVSAEKATGADFSISGDTSELYISNIENILSQEGVALNLTASEGSKVRIKELGSLESQEGSPLVVSASGQSTVAIWGIDAELLTEEATACQLTTTDEATLTLQEFPGAVSEKGTALIISAQGESSLVVKDFGDLSSQEGGAVDATVGATSRVKMQTASSISSEEGTALTGSVQGEFVVDDVLAISTQKGPKAVAITGSGATSAVELTRVPKISGDEPSEDLVSILGIHRVLLQEIDEITVQTSAKYIVFIEGSSAETGEVKLIDVLDVNGVCRGGVALRYYGEIVWHNISGPGTVSCEEGATYSVLLSYARKALIKNFSEIVNKDGSIGGVYAYQVHDISLEDIDLIEGKRAVNFLLGETRYRIFNCKELLAPESGEPACSLTGRAIIDINGGDDRTTIEAKDENTQALFIEGAMASAPEARLYSITVSADKGQTTLNQVTLDAHEVVLNGSVTSSSAYGRMLKCEFNCGLNVDSGDLRIVRSPINLGQNSGPDKTLTINDSIVFLDFPEISGSEGVTISGSIIEFAHAETPLTGAEESWSIYDTVFRGDKVAWGKDFLALDTSVLQLTKVDMPDNDITLAGEDQIIEGHHVAIGALTLGEDNSGFLSHAVFSDDITVQAGAVLVQLGKEYANNISFAQKAVGVLAGVSSVDNGEISTESDVSLMLLGLDGLGTDLDIGASAAVIVNRAVPGEIDIANNAAFLANGLEHDGSLTTEDDVALILNNYQLNTGKMTLGPRSAGVFVEAFSLQTEIQQDSGAMIVGCDLRQVDIDLNVGILAADWECNDGHITTGMDTGIVGARMRLPGEWRLGQNNGFISACGSGTWNSSNAGIGVILARHDRDLDIGGSDIGIIGVSLDNDLALSSVESGVIIAGGRGEYSGMGAIVGADVATVDNAATAIISLGAELTADDLVGVGVSSINDHDAGVVVGSGGSWEATEGSVIVGGSYTTVSTLQGLLAVGGAVTSLTGGVNTGINVTATTVSSAVTVGNYGGILRTGGMDTSTSSGGTGAGILGAGGRVSQLVVPPGGGVIKSGTYQSGGGTGWSDTGGVISAGLPQTSVPINCGGVFATMGSGATGIDGYGARIVAGGYVGNTGVAICATSEEDFHAINAGAGSTGILACRKFLQLYNFGGATVSSQSNGLVTATGGLGSGIYLGKDIYEPSVGNAQKQSRAAKTAIYDYAPEIHHNFYEEIEL
jgi:hypothetical protein